MKSWPGSQYRLYRMNRAFREEGIRKGRNTGKAILTNTGLSTYNKGSNREESGAMGVDKRYELFCELLKTMDEGVDAIDEYDSLLHDYQGTILYQAESQIIKAVGDQPGITASELSREFHKTNSACSQLIRKLKKKEWIRQERNEKNNREYNLYLTDEGKVIYKKHEDFENACYERTYHMLDEISEEEMRTYIRIQNQLNRAFKLDVEESRQLSGNGGAD